MSAQTLKEAADDVVAVLNRNFNHPRQQEFRLRMSNIGRPFCQLWYEKNKPEAGLDIQPSTMINFTIGDLVEVVVKAIIKESHADYTDSQLHEVSAGKRTIKGTSDLMIGNEIDDVKSASAYSFQHKFDNFESLRNKDDFGYVAQLVGYARKKGVELGGWWVVNKNSGELKYVECDLSDEEAEQVWEEVTAKVKRIDDDEPFERCFEDIEETFHRKATGNRILDPNSPCVFCPYRFDCWPGLEERPDVNSKSKTPKTRYYTKLVNAESEEDGAVSE